MLTVDDILEGDFKLNGVDKRVLVQHALREEIKKYVDKEARIRKISVEEIMKHHRVVVSCKYEFEFLTTTPSELPKANLYFDLTPR